MTATQSKEARRNFNCVDTYTKEVLISVVEWNDKAFRVIKEAVEAIGSTHMKSVLEITLKQFKDQYESNTTSNKQKHWAFTHFGVIEKIRIFYDNLWSTRNRRRS
jgi:hypothetical protein